MLLGVTGDGAGTPTEVYASASSVAVGLGEVFQLEGHLRIAGTGDGIAGRMITVFVTSSRPTAGTTSATGVTNAKREIL